MPLDPNSLPDEVLAAARTLESFFRQSGVEDWALLGVCSRAMYERCKAKHDALVDRVAHPYLGGWNFPPSA